MKFTIVYDWLRTGRGPAVDSVAKFPGNFATESSKYEAILSEKKFCCLHKEYMYCLHITESHKNVTPIWPSDSYRFASAKRDRPPTPPSL